MQEEAGSVVGAVLEGVDVVAAEVAEVDGADRRKAAEAGRDKPKMPEQSSSSRLPT